MMAEALTGFVNSMRAVKMLLRFSCPISWAAVI